MDVKRRDVLKGAAASVAVASAAIISADAKRRPAD